MLVAFLAGASASAQNEPAAQPSISPTVSFVEPGPLTIGLASLRAQDGLSIELHNDVDEAQDISLRVVGLSRSEDPAAAKLLSAEPVSAPVSSGETVTLRVPLGPDSMADPKAGDYAATLVANGEAGGLARRQLTVKVADAETADRPAALSPTDVGDVSIGAINFLPSLLSQLAFLAIAIAVIGLMVIFIFRARLRRLWIAIAAIVAVALLAVGVAGVAGGELPELNRIHAISSRSVPVTGDSNSGTVGVASNSTGELVRLSVEDAELRANDLAAAGTYVGSFDLSTEPDKGEAEATVNVTDYWIWAFLALGIGVLIGYWVRRWFQGRAGRQLKIRVEELREKLNADDEQFNDRAQGHPFADYQANRIFAAWTTEIESLIADGEFDLAETEFDELADFVDGFIKLRSELTALSEAVERVEAQRSRRAFGVREPSVWVRSQANELLGTSFDSDQPFEKAEELKEHRAKAKTLTVLAAAVTELHASAATHYAAAERLMKQASPNRKKELETVKSLATEVGKGALLAQSLDDLKPLRPKDEQAAEILAKPREGEKVTELPMMLLDAYEPRGSEPKLQFLTRRLAKVPRTKPRVRLSHSVLRTTGLVPDGDIHVKDEVFITAKFDRGNDLGFAEVIFEFSDGRRIKRQVPIEGENVVLVTSFNQAGAQTIRLLRPEPEGGERLLGALELEVDSRSRSEVARSIFETESREMSAVAVTLAIGSGLLALYVTEPSWGEPQDYLAALLWGAVTSEGITLAAAIADKVWPGK